MDERPESKDVLDAELVNVELLERVGRWWNVCCGECNNCGADGVRSSMLKLKRKTKDPDRGFPSLVLEIQLLTWLFLLAFHP